jgi:hypothetical protein
MWRPITRINNEKQFTAEGAENAEKKRDGGAPVNIPYFLFPSLVPKLQLGNAPMPEAPASFFPAVVLLFNPHRQDA